MIDGTDKARGKRRGVGSGRAVVTGQEVDSARLSGYGYHCDAKRTTRSGTCPGRVKETHSSIAPSLTPQRQAPFFLLYQLFYHFLKKKKKKREQDEGEKNKKRVESSSRRLPVIVQKNAQGRRLNTAARSNTPVSPSWAPGRRRRRRDGARRPWGPPRPCRTA